MSNRLAGRVIVVTGAGGLLGKEHSTAIINEGGIVVMVDVNMQPLRIFYESLPVELQKRCHISECDITNEKEVEALLNSLLDQDLHPSGLVNNAAINPSVEKNTSRFTRLENLSIRDWDFEISVGLTGALICSRVFGIYMVENKITGSIVNISSDHGLISPNQSLYAIPGIAPEKQSVKPVTYSVIKHAIIGLTKYLATYWATDGVRVNSLCPGGVLNGQPEEFLAKFNLEVPMNRAALPTEFRGALIFMLSEESSYMTGSTVVVDGGRSIW
ncbi:SDR family oxidoreductase [Candidatus Planktophila versatilis]|uniref:SDR family oxidoreductase n=1 Tax=Candidatus Planktophila versatilis TaxID=1884905 RepID=UPI003CE764E1